MRIVVLAGLAVIVAIAVISGVVVWTSGGAAPCDTAALESAMRAGIARGDHMAEGSEVRIDMPSGCGEAEMTNAMPAVSRTWHVMPGGSMMRLPEHANP